MLFRKDMERHCAWCEHASVIDEQDMLCQKFGAVSRYYCCKKYKYDPLKRIPSKKVPIRADGFQTNNFSLTSEQPQQNTTP